MEYRIYKGENGWRAMTQIPFGTQNQILKLTTSKRDAGYVATHASVSRVERGFETFAVFSDFSQTVERCFIKRITEDVVRKVHEQALGRIDEIKAQAEAYYAAKQQAA